MRYFFHLREAGGYLLDDEGLELAGLEAARAAATQAARSIIAGDAILGKLPLGAVVEVDDEAGHRMFDLAVRETVLIDG
jgi:hypothetical protein